MAAGFGVEPFVVVPFVAAPFNAASTLAAAPLALVRDRVGGEPSDPAGAARREAFRAGRAAGTVSAGRSARVRGATIVHEV